LRIFSSVIVDSFLKIARATRGVKG